MSFLCTDIDITVCELCRLGSATCTLACGILKRPTSTWRNSMRNSNAISSKHHVVEIALGLCGNCALCWVRDGLDGAGENITSDRSEWNHPLHR